LVAVDSFLPGRTKDLSAPPRMFVKKDIALPAIQFFQRDISTYTFVILTLFEVLRIVRIHNAVWVRTSHNVVHSYKYSGSAF